MSAVLPRSAALAAWLSLACGHRPTSAPLVPVVAVPFDAYGGAIYVPAVINGDSVWLMLDTGLSRTGLDRDWARSVGIARAPAPGGDEEAPTATPATAVVDTIRLGELTLANQDRKSTRLNSSHRCISYAVFCLKKKKQTKK